MFEDQDEELNLITTSKRYIFGLKYLKLVFKLTSLRWDENKSEEKGEGNHLNQDGANNGSTLDLLVLEDSSSDPPELFAKSRLMQFIWRCRYTRFICHSFVYYAILKLVLTAIHHFRYYNLQRLAKSMNKTDNEQNIRFINTINSSRRWLILLGDPYISISGIPMTIYYFTAATPLLLYLVEYFWTTAKREYVSHLNFLFNPRGERIHVGQKLRLVISDLIYTRKDLYQSNGYFGPEYHFKTMNIRQRFYTDYVNNQMQTAFKQVLRYIQEHNLVQPANLTNQWLAKLTTINIVVLGWFFFFWILSSYMNVVLCILVEWYFRASQRLDSIKLRQNYSSTFNESGLYDLLELNEEDRWTYAESDGSMLSKFYLVFTVEPKYYFTLSITLYLLEVFILNVFFSVWGSLHLHLIFLGGVHKLKWAYQIEKQINSCIDLLATSRNGDKNGDDVLNKILIISYLNYTHYRNCYKEYKIKASSLVSKMLLLLGLYFLLIYSVALRLEPNFKNNIIATMIGVACLFNLYLTSCSYMLVQSEKILKAISRLLAKGPLEHNKKHLLAISLWHRHLLDTKELKNLFAIRIFGARIDRNFLVTFNAYFIALVILYK